MTLAKIGGDPGSQEARDWRLLSRRVQMSNVTKAIKKKKKSKILQNEKEENKTKNDRNQPHQKSWHFVTERVLYLNS